MVTSPSVACSEMSPETVRFSAFCEMLPPAARAMSPLLVTITAFCVMSSSAVSETLAAPRTAAFCCSEPSAPRAMSPPPRVTTISSTNSEPPSACTRMSPPVEFRPNGVGSPRFAVTPPMVRSPSRSVTSTPPLPPLATRRSALTFSALPSPMPLPAVSARLAAVRLAAPSFSALRMALVAIRVMVSEVVPVATRPMSSEPPLVRVMLPVSVSTTPTLRSSCSAILISPWAVASTLPTWVSSARVA
ncbi:hypothetical protein D9M69_150220 [compost metagenome]